MLVERSPNVRGVLDEIGRITRGPLLKGSPLASLFGEAVPKAGTKSACQVENVPAILSAAQEKLVTAAASQPVTVCHGPPGTGKTFTLAAAAIEHAARGEAVLVVCRSEKAADVMERAIDRLAGSPDLSLRTGSRRAVKKLREQIDLLLGGAEGEVDPEVFKQADRALRRGLAALRRETRELESGLVRARSNGRWFDPPGEPVWWQRLRRWMGERQVAASPLLMDSALRLAELQQERIRLARELGLARHRRTRGELLDDPVHRKTLRAYRNALRRRTSGAWERDLAAIDPALLSRLFPLWIVESDDVHRVLPLQQELFPLVVIDEASQCDLASPVPAIHRGRRVLIAGDPQQLRHVTFVPEVRLGALAERHGIPRQTRERLHYRRVSLIDAALDASDALHFLSEHFRSRPELIAFSNRRFYGGKLQVMRELAESGPWPAASIHRIDGERDDGGVNRRELEAVAEFLSSWLEEAGESGLRPSVGFLSPFRAQVDAFESVVGGQLGPEAMGRLVRDHDLIVSTAHGFQGDERDVMVLSLALTDKCPVAARRFLEREDVFNVSVTRARDRVVVFCSMDRGRLPGDSLLAGWFASLEPQGGPRADPERCRWIREVEAQLVAQGWQCETGRSVGGIPLDLLVGDGQGKRIALDLVGQRGAAGTSVPLCEQLLLQRAGLSLLPLGIDEWRGDPAKCLESIREKLAGKICH
nr:ATP-binding protein [Luteolibacter marinus]